MAAPRAAWTVFSHGWERVEGTSGASVTHARSTQHPARHSPADPDSQHRGEAKAARAEKEGRVEMERKEAARAEAAAINERLRQKHASAAAGGSE